MESNFNSARINFDEPNRLMACADFLCLNEIEQLIELSPSLTLAQIGYFRRISRAAQQ